VVKLLNHFFSKLVINFIFQRRKTKIKKFHILFLKNLIAKLKNKNKKQKQK
jgi:hypothetical protein